MSFQDVVERMKERACDSCSKSDELKGVDWEEFQDAVARLCGLATVLIKERVRREALCEQVEGALESHAKVLKQADAMECMRLRLHNKRMELERAVASLQKTTSDLVRAKEKLWPPAQVFFSAAGALVAARGRLEDAKKMLCGQGGQGRLAHLSKLVDERRCLMISEVAALYPLATCTPPNSLPAATSSCPVQQPTQSKGQQPVSHRKSGENGKQAADSVSDLTPETASIAIAGLQLLAPLKRKPGLFDEKHDYEVSATALGYVAHVVSLIGSYLDVPLRYPLRLRASRSYIQDPAPAFDMSSSDVGPIIPVPHPENPPKTAVEFPLFSEGKELTKSAYAVFLLNKDLEQLLNWIGMEVVGPRHTLQNLNRLINCLLWGRRDDSGGAES